MGMDLITAISSVAATLGNIGPGLGQVGPAAHYGDIPALGKLVLILCMLAGRLEIYTILILLFPEFWRK
jgi:trk system potassium uptake protein TrkH